MANDYLLTEVESDIAFAVISADNKTTMIGLVALAIKEEFSYEDVTFRSDSYSERSGIVFMSFNCLSEDGEEDIREVELNLTAIYSLESLKMENEDVIKHLKKFGNEKGIFSLLGILMLVSFILICSADWQTHYVFLVIVSVQIVSMGYLYFESKWKINKLRKNGTT